MQKKRLFHVKLLQNAKKSKHFLLETNGRCTSFYARNQICENGANNISSYRWRCGGNFKNVNKDRDRSTIFNFFIIFIEKMSQFIKNRYILNTLVRSTPFSSVNNIHSSCVSPKNVYEWRTYDIIPAKVG